VPWRPPSRHANPKKPRRSLFFFSGYFFFFSEDIHSCCWSSFTHQKGGCHQQKQRPPSSSLEWAQPFLFFLLQSFTYKLGDVLFLPVCELLEIFFMPFFPLPTPFTTVDPFDLTTFRREGGHLFYVPPLESSAPPFPRFFPCWFLPLFSLFDTESPRALFCSRCPFFPELAPLGARALFLPPS